MSEEAEKKKATEILQAALLDMQDNGVAYINAIAAVGHCLGGMLAAADEDVDYPAFLRQLGEWRNQALGFFEGQSKADEIEIGSIELEDPRLDDADVRDFSEMPEHLQAQMRSMLASGEIKFAPGCEADMQKLGITKDEIIGIMAKAVKAAH